MPSEWKCEYFLKKNSSEIIFWITIKSQIYEMHFNRQLNGWSFRCSWSIACRRCTNYIFILHLTPGFNILCKTTARRDKKYLSFGIWCVFYWRFYGTLQALVHAGHDLSHPCVCGCLVIATSGHSENVDGNDMTFSAILWLNFSNMKSFLLKRGIYLYQMMRSPKTLRHLL